MIPFNITDWYWRVAEDEAEVWSSARATAVPVADEAYVEWQALEGHFPTPIGSMDELEDVFRRLYPPGMLQPYTAHVRTQTSGGGITVNGLPFATDVITVGSLNSAYIYTIDKQSNEFSWKLPDGSFITLSTADITALQGIVAQFGQDCFVCEDTVLAGIEDGTITTHAEIDAAFAAIPNTFTGVSADAVKSQRHKRAEGASAESYKPKRSTEEALQSLKNKRA